MANEDLLARIRASVELVKNMSEAERAELHRQQRESWVRGEMSWPKPKFNWVNGVKVYDSYSDYCNG